MKKILVKRVVYIDHYGKEYIGGEEYSGSLSNHNILCSRHEVGKTQWFGNELWVMRDGVPTYRITVSPFYQYQKRWYELLLDAVRRI